MGLRCLIGHDFGDLQTEEEHESRGDEEVITIREYRECARCGEQKVISENKEVTASKDLTPNLQDAETAVDEQPPMPAGSTSGAGDEFENVSAEEDDGVILKDGVEEEEVVRNRGEWPEREDTIEPEIDPQSWPETNAEEDEGYDAEPADGGPADEVDFKGGLTPERHASSPHDAAGPAGEVVEEPPPPDQSTEPESPEAKPEPASTTTTDQPSQIEQEDESVVGAGEAQSPKAEATGSARGEMAGSGITSGDASPQPTGQQRPDGETEFVCPECDHVAEATGSSLRPGDICPECHRGYLLERERQT